MTMDNREAIIKTIDKIAQLSKQPGNKWLLEEFFKRFGLEETGGNSKLDEIYEYCIEKVIKEQAKGFYKDISFKDIEPQLEFDFVRMERARRRNDFDEFAMAIYQQIERITNVVCSNKKLNESVSKLMGHPAYVNSVVQKNGTWSTPSISDRNTTSSYQIAKLLFGKSAPEKALSNLSAQWAVDKIYCVLYFLCYQAKLKSHEYSQFTEYKYIYNAIYQFRNLNHRSSVMKDEQKEIIDRIRPQQGVYYFKFMQALLFYVEGVTKGLSSLDELYNYAQSQKRIDVTELNVLGKIELSEKDKKRFK